MGNKPPASNITYYFVKKDGIYTLANQNESEMFKDINSIEVFKNKFQHLQDQKKLFFQGYYSKEKKIKDITELIRIHYPDWNHSIGGEFQNIIIEEVDKEAAFFGPSNFVIYNYQMN